MFITSGAILDFFRDRELHEKAHSYVRSHAKRYAFLFEHVSNVRATLAQPDGPVTILDIGPSFFTELLRHAFPRGLDHHVGLRLATKPGRPFSARHPSRKGDPL